MGRNVEIKARVVDMVALEERARRLADDPPQVLIQHDTFFSCASGRLKLRVFGDGTGELIFYRRDDASGPRESRYTKTPTADPDGLLNTLAAALGVSGEVRKRRTLLLVGQTRVHLDQVEGLGAFLELEVVLTPEQSLDDGTVIANDLTKKLGITADDLVATAYVDLLENSRENSS